MTYTREREDFIARMSREGLDLDTTRTLLRHASTSQRLAVAMCNGDWPADNGERRTRECPRCAGHWAPASFVRVKLPASVPVGRRKWDVAELCPDCRAEQHVRVLLAGTPWRPVFGGDPRGAVLRLVPVSALDADVESGRERGIYVPARER